MDGASSQPVQPVQPVLQEVLSKDNFVRARLAVARLLPGEITAETMLRWVQRARPEALGRLARG